MPIPNFFAILRAFTGLLLQCIVYGIMVYSWYVYVFRLCVTLLFTSGDPNIPLGVVLVTIGSLLSLTASISYIRVIFTTPGYPNQVTGDQMMDSQSSLPRYCYSPSLFDKDTYKSILTQDTTMMPALSISQADGSPRYCDLCHCLKPDRTHHCGVCNTCVLKMDHHCPWINNCVGHHNYKFFFLFVWYTGLYALWCLGSGIPLVIIAVHDQVSC
ncbi:DHHC palmitoyltransferase-domain-containing protein [Chlamydoabsidia padenii]|nr:DHHC palmitoyltransferase-domain-containing protein [Chlamydoabsidia padenii]